MTAWTISTGAPTVVVGADRRAAAALTVTNRGATPDRAVVELVPDDPATLPWLAVADPQRAVLAGATAVFEVTVTVPPDAPPGPHWFAGRVYSADVAPEETSQLSDRILYTVPAQAAPPKQRRWWPYAVAAALVLVVVGVVVFLATRPGPVPTPPPQLVAVSVPEVVGLRVADAEQQLQAAGLRVVVHPAPVEFPSDVGTVLSSNPRAGSVVDPGSTVDLNVGAPLGTPTRPRQPPANLPTAAPPALPGPF